MCVCVDANKLLQFQQSKGNQTAHKHNHTHREKLKDIHKGWRQLWWQHEYVKILLVIKVNVIWNEDDAWVQLNIVGIKFLIHTVVCVCGNFPLYAEKTIKICIMWQHIICVCVSRALHIYTLILTYIYVLPMWVCILKGFFFGQNTIMAFKCGNSCGRQCLTWQWAQLHTHIYTYTDTLALLLLVSIAQILFTASNNG